jgi:hypothetical protein
VVGFVEEGGVRIEAIKHGIDPGAHKTLNIYLINVLGDELLVKCPVDLKTLSQGKKVITTRKKVSARESEAGKEYHQRGGQQALMH